MATHGNATFLEVFFSNQIIETSPAHAEMRDNWQKFMDTNAFVKASIGYAKNNRSKFEERNPLGVKGQLRQHKFAIAYCRVLWQCLKFLETGEFKCQIDEGPFKEMLLKWKNGWNDDFTMEAMETYFWLLAEVEQAWADVKPEFVYTPDIPWIEDFIYRTYNADLLRYKSIVENYEDLED